MAAASARRRSRRPRSSASSRIQIRHAVRRSSSDASHANIIGTPLSWSRQLRKTRLHCCGRGAASAERSMCSTLLSLDLNGLLRWLTTGVRPSRHFSCRGVVRPGNTTAARPEAPSASGLPIRRERPDERPEPPGGAHACARRTPPATARRPAASSADQEPGPVITSPRKCRVLTAPIAAAPT